MKHHILGKTIEQWTDSIPLLAEMRAYKPVFWINPERRDEQEETYKSLELSWQDVLAAEERWKRFAPLLQLLFPETAANCGIIESPLIEIHEMKKGMEGRHGLNLGGRLFLKCDHALPVAGSIKARGGIYEVLKHAEELAVGQELLREGQDYSAMGSQAFRDFYGRYSLAVGSTGNLGLSIGIMGAALGFQVTVHMSADAKQWKKDLLRSKGVTVIEYGSDYSKAVEEGRKQALQYPACYFVDDEHSKDLFLGYSAAAIGLKKQLEEQGITVDREHPLFVYLPCGVGGAPGGICFGLKQLFHEAVHCFFVEPTHSPCMLLGLVTGENDSVSVQEFGIDNLTEGDGLAVGRPSGFAGNMVKKLLSGIYTIEDDQLYRLLALLKDKEDIEIEPSAASSLLGMAALMGSEEGQAYIGKRNLEQCMKNSVHIAWATGGSFVPAEMKEEFYQKGKKLLEQTE
jgi:D-serine dehydratase